MGGAGGRAGGSRRCCEPGQRAAAFSACVFLIAAALASDSLWPWLKEVSFATVQRVVTVALAVILFDISGMRMGWQRFRSAAVATVWAAW